MIGKSLLICWLVGLIIFIVFVTTVNVRIGQQVTGWYEQAYASATAEQMVKYFDKTLEGMENTGLNKGYHALIFKTPDNDMTVEYEIIKGLRDRAIKISETYDVGSVDYAASLIDIRSQMEKLKFSPAYGWMVKHYSWVLWLFGAGSLHFLLLVPIIALWRMPYKPCRGGWKWEFPPDFDF